MTELADGRPTDAELMASLAAGDVGALGKLFERHSDAVMAFLDRVLVSAPAADVEDLCQEVFLIVQRKAPRYEERGKLRSWLFQIALREARSLRRRRWIKHRLLRRFWNERGDRPSPSAGTADSTLLTEMSVSRAIDELPISQREVLVLAVSEGMSGDEIAETLGISHSAVRVRLHRARRAIREAVCGGDPPRETGEDR